MANTYGSDTAKDLDETRRLMYMALVRQRTEKYELAGTIINALLHHQSIDTPVADVVEHVIKVIEGLEGDTASGMWMRRQINRISTALGD